MASKLAAVCLATCAWLLAGCSTGVLYSDTVRPLSTDYHATPVGSKRAEVNVYRVKEPISGYNLSAEWDVAALKRVAAEQGITQLHYADIRRIAVLNGLWRRTTYIFHGE